MITITRNKSTGRFQRSYSCSSCQILQVNGIPCHEVGCPDSWKDYPRECAFCGVDFLPEERYQTCCGEECAEAYYG